METKQGDDNAIINAKSMLELVVAIAKYTGDKIVDTAQLDGACKNYLDKYTERYGVIKILGMSRPVKLEDIYTELKLLTPDYLNRFSSVEDLQSLFLEKTERSLAGYSFHDDDPESGLDIANSEDMQYFNLLGSPGSGKSTFLRYIGLMALQGYRRTIIGRIGRKLSAHVYKYNLIPVLIELNRFEKGKLNLLEHIDHELNACGFPKHFAASALEHGTMLVLLDGVDEIPKGVLTRAIRSIRDFVTRYSKNRFITSCRTAFYKTWFHNFHDYIIADFTNNQIKSFINNWFSTDGVLSRAGAELWKMLDNEENESMLELARTPLLAAFISMTYESTGNLPNNRSELYGESLRIILEKWSASRRTHLGPVYDGLYGKNYLSMLELLAGPAFEAGQFFFREKELTNKIEEYLVSALNYPKKVDGRKILTEIEKKQGLFIERVRNLYSFSHLTIQEYLSACYYYKNGMSSRIANEYLGNDQWREVIILLSGLHEPSGDGYLLGIAENLQSILSRDGAKSLYDLILWCSAIVNKKLTAESQAIRRALLINIYFKAMNDTKVVKGITRMESRGSAEAIDDIIKYESEYYGNMYSPTSKMITTIIAYMLNSIERQRSGNYDIILNSDVVNVRSNKIDDMMYGHVAVDTIDFLERYEVVNPTVSKRMRVAKNELLHEDFTIGTDRTVHNYAKLFQSLQLPKKLWRFGSKYIGVTNEYIKGVLRLYECKEAALRVTKLGWEQVAEKIFKVQDKSN